MQWENSFASERASANASGEMAAGSVSTVDLANGHTLAAGAAAGKRPAARKHFCGLV